MFESGPVFFQVSPKIFDIVGRFDSQSRQSQKSGFPSAFRDRGGVLKEIDLGPVWCGPTVSRGRVYVGTGNLLFAPGNPQEAYFPKSMFGLVISFGLPGEDEVGRMKTGDE